MFKTTFIYSFIMTVIKKIIANINARKEDKPIKSIRITSEDILNEFFLPLFRPENNIDERFAELIFMPCSYIEISYKTLSDAIEMLSEELEDEYRYEYDFDKHHWINKGIDAWLDDIAGRIIKRIGKDRYYNYEDNKEVNEHFINEIGWEELITDEDDDNFESEFVEFMREKNNDLIRKINDLFQELTEGLC